MEPLMQDWKLELLELHRIIGLDLEETQDQQVLDQKKPFY